MIDYAARLLRPGTILARVGNAGLAVIESVYPHQSCDTVFADSGAALPTGRRVVHHVGAPDTVLAVDCGTLVRQARRTDGVIELVPRVGDFVASGEPLLVLYGAAAAIDDRVLRATVAFGPERTMEQDPLFAFRIVVDIALKALSPAINDPTTAVLALDQIHRLLRTVGRRQLRGETITDELGHRRLIFRTPNWEDFVSVACTEIRCYGAGNVQIARRLRAMFDDLMASLPAYRHHALDQQSRGLTRMLESLYLVPDDIALARLPDLQGLGGSWGARSSTR